MQYPTANRMLLIKSFLQSQMSDTSLRLNEQGVRHFLRAFISRTKPRNKNKKKIYPVGASSELAPTMCCIIQILVRTRRNVPLRRQNKNRHRLLVYITA
jgi:hypothetical protein